MSTLAGTGVLLRIALRRDRVVLPAWILTLGALTVGQAGGIEGLYVTQQDREAYALTSASSAAARVFGAVDGPAPGSIMMVELFVLLSILVAIMHWMLVVRHTRADEQAGRLELVRSAIVGRHAPLAAALLLVLVANVILVTVLLGALVVGGGLPLGGSLLLALGWGGVGLVFAAVGAVTAQLAPGPRMANGLAAIVLAAAFVLRAAGDVAGEVSADGMHVQVAWPSWLSPLGWTQLAYPFGEQRWWTLLAYPLATGALIAVAVLLSSRRDVARGLLPEPRGRARASRWLGSPLALVVRLQRTTIAAWLVGIAAMGAFGGAFTGEVETMLGENEQARAVFEAAGGTDVLVDAYHAVMLGYLGLLAAVFALQLVLRLRGEERGPGESLLATGTSRLGWASSHVLVAATAGAASLALGGAAMGLLAVLTGEAVDVGGLLAGALVQVPAVLVFVGVATLGFGVSTRLAALLGWALFAIATVVLVGTMFDLPEWAQQASPFAHLPLVPVEEVAWTPILALAAVALASAAAGLARFRLRDVETGV